MSTGRYRDLAGELKRRFGCRVQKISVDAGLGCPNRDGTIGLGGCIYCNRRGSGTGLGAELSIRAQLQRGKERLGRRYGARKFIAYFQSYTNTYAPVAELERLYEEALAVEDVVGLAIGTRPDCVDDEVLDLLADFGRRTHLWVEYGLQSIHDRTLEKINRGHDAATFIDAVDRSRSRGLEVVVHVILGLPGETKEDMLATARALGALDIQGVKIHLLYVIAGTKLADLHQAGHYQCLTRGAYVDTVCDFLALLPPQVVIHRLTGDPHPHELIAPAWALSKRENLEAVRQALVRRDLWQGKHHQAAVAEGQAGLGQLAGGGES